MKFKILNPTDQPLGTHRLIDDLKANLKDPDFIDFGLAVAFAKSGPLYRLLPYIQEWKKANKTIEAIFGIDHKGTSKEALIFALEHFDRTHITQYPNYSFHPKIYWFKGKKKAVVYIGSNNLTVGGTEINFEAGVKFEFDLPKDQEALNHSISSYNGLLPAACNATQILTSALLNSFIKDGKLTDEELQKKELSKSVKSEKKKDENVCPVFAVKPPSSIPRCAFGKNKSKRKTEAIITQAKSVDIAKPFIPVNGFAIQIKPHNNGEIFLSKYAAEDNPRFFGMPFTGLSHPKKSKNVGYPQRDPDPIVNITVYGAANVILIKLSKYPLNTVFYDTKSEIRITAVPLVKHVPEYSIMLMSLAEEFDIDYHITIFTTDSPEYLKWLPNCNTVMPGGGKTPRKYGWF